MIIFIIIALLIAAGLLGGYAGYLQGPPSPDDLPDDKKSSLRFRSLVLGVVGAFLVPVFLTIVRATSGSDDDLIDQLSSEKAPISGWFVLFGFALLAGISSQRLISNLTKKLFDDVFARAESAERIANSAREEVDELDDELEQVAMNRFVRESESIMSEPLSDHSTKVLEAIYRAPERRPNRQQIAQAGNLKAEELDQALIDLEDRGLVRSKDYDGTKGWRVRTAGKTLLAARQLPSTQASLDAPSG